MGGIETFHFPTYAKQSQSGSQDAKFSCRGVAGGMAKVSWARLSFTGPCQGRFPSCWLPNQSASCREKETSVSLSQQVIASAAIAVERQALRSS